MIEAKVICDSVSPEGIRLTTMKLRYPKFCHGEFMTHRVFSRNASSSRAIPVSKCIEEVRSDALLAAPVWWGKNQPGMQAVEELPDDPIPHADRLPKERGGPGSARYTLVGCSSQRRCAQDEWELAALSAAGHAEELFRYGAHKQIVNRILEPFLHINVVCTATDYDNFFGLRLDRAAQPEMRALALAMWEARQVSNPAHKNPDDWHTPFVRFDHPEDNEQTNNYILSGHDDLTYSQIMARVSVARCARVSYESFETGRRSTVDEDLALYDRLLSSRHLSPFEHQATPDTIESHPLYDPITNTSAIVTGWSNPKQHGNFVGWRQYRKQIPNEAVMPLPEEFRT